MYEEFFGLTRGPFSVTPDPAFLYFSRKHRAALTMLHYGMSRDAPLVLITGAIGSGKTTLIRQLLSEIEQTTTVGLISNTHAAFGDLLQWICLAFGLPVDGSEKVLHYKRFEDFLLAEFGRGRRVVLVVDEAQNLSMDALEELRVLSNINADGHVLLQIVISGQPELRTILRQQRMEQLTQRIAVDFHLEPLDGKETREYVAHRLRVAGATERIFSSAAIEAVYRHAEGVPRLVNVLCDTALVYAYAEGRRRISERLVDEIVAERAALGLFGAGKTVYGAAIASEANVTQPLPMSDGTAA